MMTTPTPGRTAKIGWIVDVQNDFMLPPEQGGRLYVHDLFDDGSDAGATQIVPALVRATEWMRAHCDAVVYTGDWHNYEDAEIDPVAPDATKGTYPPHCMGLSPDARWTSGGPCSSTRAGSAYSRETPPPTPSSARCASGWAARLRCT